SVVSDDRHPLHGCAMDSVAFPDVLAGGRFLFKSSMALLSRSRASVAQCLQLDGRKRALRLIQLAAVGVLVPDKINGRAFFLHIEYASWDVPDGNVCCACGPVAITPV